MYNLPGCTQPGEGEEGGGVSSAIRGELWLWEGLGWAWLVSKPQTQEEKPSCPSLQPEQCQAPGDRLLALSERDLSSCH